MVRFLIAMTLVSLAVQVSPAQKPENETAEHSQAIVYAHPDTKSSDLITIRDLLRPHVDEIALTVVDKEGIRVKIFADFEEAKAKNIADQLKKQDVSKIEFAPFELEWIDFSYEKFEELKGKRNVVAYFRADWCATSVLFERKIKADADLLLKLRTFDIQFLRVDRTEHGGTADRFANEQGVLSVPMMLCYSKQRPDQKFVIEDIEFSPVGDLSNLLESAFQNEGEANSESESDREN